MRWFISASIIVVIATLVSARQLFNKYNNLEDVEQEFNNVFQLMEHVSPKVVTSTPVVSNLMNGELVIVSTGGVVSLFTRKNESLWSVALIRR